MDFAWAWTTVYLVLHFTAILYFQEVLHFDEMLCHDTEKDLDTQNLPPMISVSPDGEEGFAVSQRVLQNIRNKPYSEVPPNKTICHIQYKFVNSK